MEVFLVLLWIVVGGVLVSLLPDVARDWVSDRVKFWRWSK